MADIDLNVLISNLSKSFANDPRYEAPSSIDLTLTANALQVNVVAKLRQGNGILPITIPLSQ